MEENVMSQHFKAWHLSGPEGSISYMACVCYK